MAAVAITAVGGGTRRDKARALSAHLIGLAAGGITVFVVAAGIGAAIPGALRASLIPIAGAVGVTWGALKLLGRAPPVLSSAAQVPLSWRYTMERGQYLLAYGVGLGLGVFTRIYSLSLYLALVLVIASGNALLALLSGACYGIARGLSVAVALCRSPDDGAEATQRFIAALERTYGHAVRTDALCVTLVGLAAVVSGVYRG